MVVAIALTGLAAPGAARAATAAPASAPFSLANPTFDTSTTGWFESTVAGTLEAVRPGRTGTAAVRLRHSAASASTVILNDTVNTVRSTQAGAVYTATAWVRASRASTVAIRLQEWAATKRGEQLASYPVGTGWQQIGVSYTARTASASLDLNVLGVQLAPGVTLDVDDLTFRARTPVWSDEFATTGLDATSWSALNNSTFGDGNGELACLTSRPENLRVTGGALALTARAEYPALRCGSTDTRFPTGRDYSSAFVQTKGKRAFTYGRFEVRATLPTAAGSSQGLWPAFWMRPVDGGPGEIDILEALGGPVGGAEADRVHQTIHYDYLPTYPKQTATVRLPVGTPSDGPHSYAVEWDPGRIQWFVDGRLTSSRDRATTPWLDAAFSRPMYLRLNLAVGGRWPGAPDATTRLPADYLIDSVRVYSPSS